MFAFPIGKMLKVVDSIPLFYTERYYTHTYITCRKTDKKHSFCVLYDTLSLDICDIIAKIQL